MKIYTIYIRYEYNTSSGKQWTDWFHAILTPYTSDINLLNNIIEQQKESDSTLTAITKQKREYLIKEIIK